MASGPIIRTLNGTKVAVVDWKYSETHALVDVIGKEGSYQTMVAKNGLVRDNGEPLDENGS